MDKSGISMLGFNQIRKLRKIRQAKRIFYEYNKYLKCGVYRLNNSAVCFDEISYVEKELCDFETLVSKNKASKSEHIFRVEHEYNEFDCTKMLITNHGQIIKCFDYIQNVVVSIFESKDSFMQYLNERKQASHFFSTSDICNVNEKEMYIVETLLIDDTTTDEQKWKCILEYYLKMSYAPNEKKATRMLLMEHKYKKNQEIFGKYYHKQGMNEIRIPVAKQHGDLWTANVFCMNGECRVIDFGTFGSYMFFYDLALYMFTEAFIRKNDFLLKQYLNKKYDFWIEKICSNYGIDLNSFGHEELFVCAMEEMIYKRFNKFAGKKMVISIVKFLNDMGISI